MGPWTHRSLARVAMLVLLVCASSASASEIGIFFDPQGSTDMMNVTVGQTFQFYILGDGVSGGMKGFELGVRVDPRVTLLAGTQQSPGVELGSGEDNWVLGFSACNTSRPATLVVYSAMLVSDGGGVQLSLEASSPSSVSGFGPAYLTCGTPTVYAFEDVYAALLNPDEQSWGAVKQLYN
jgi:hypothetical protein